MKKLCISIILLFAISFTIYGQSRKELSLTYLPKGALSLRSNAISWMMLMPNIGAEYKLADNIGLIIDGSLAHWSFSMQNKYWRIWYIAPQTRYYIGEAKYNYIGLQYVMGEYNFLGNQGKYIGGGLNFGHQFYAGRNLMVDLGLSLGYLHLHDKEKYQRVDGHDYRKGIKTSGGYWGPTGLNVTFVWKIN